MYNPTKKDAVRSLLITVVFNTLIALVMTYMVLEKNDFFDIFMVSQFIGLSICTFVTGAIRLFSGDSIKMAAVGVLSGLTAGVVFGSLLSWGYMVLVHDMNFAFFLKDVFLYIFVFGFVFGIPIVYFFSSWEKIQESEKMIQSEKIKRLTMEKQAAMTTLQLLQAQIEPHFLFNTLSNVIALFDTDAEKAKKMLIDLNEYLRISLQRTRQEMITLDQELSFVRQYLDIFKIRMGKRLSYTISDNTGKRGIPFPPLIIQPLVENSIKYGLEPKVDGGSIAVDCRIEAGRLVISVVDTGLGLDKGADKAGIGIDNVSRRLSSIYDEKAGLVLKENSPTGLTAIIEVPL
ncbi:MAG: histidine kinase [Desulfobacterales bacterium]|nr:histidine kinase [Desulfobacterales bacterium]